MWWPSWRASSRRGAGQGTQGTWCRLQAAVAGDLLFAWVRSKTLDHMSLVVVGLGEDTDSMDPSDGLPAVTCRTQAHDTTAEAHLAQLEAYRRMGPARRLEIALDLSDQARRISVAGILSRHPEYTPAQAAQALRRLLLGDATCRAAWPQLPLMDA